MRTILGIVGARPNFIKMAPVIDALRQRPGVRTLLVHTGQHLDPAMSDVIFQELGLPAPDLHLGVGTLSPWAQAARIIEACGDLIARERPDWVVVPGDVNSTLAGAVAAVRTGTRLAHLESGLRSFDRSMPEELNRIATDHLADRLYVTEPSGLRNLRREGIPDERIRSVGNTMVDTLRRSQPHAQARRVDIEPDGPFILMTVHRPHTVDNFAGLQRLCAILEQVIQTAPVVFPVHPRTRRRLHEHGLAENLERLPELRLVDPLGYLDFLALMLRARIVMTDSGGIQEETTALGVPCLTLRPNTERPITCEVGTNRVVGTDPAAVAAALREFWESPPQGQLPEGWDGQAAQRVADDLLG